jgi:hypothetical protein
MKKLEGSDDRAMVLDGNQLQVLRWGAEQNQFPVTELQPGEVYRDDKGKMLGVFGKKEQRARVTFGGIATTIWVPLERQAEAESFVSEVNKAVESTSS